jgi:hypothetical protein
MNFRTTVRAIHRPICLFFHGFDFDAAFGAGIIDEPFSVDGLGFVEGWARQKNLSLTGSTIHLPHVLQVK